MIRSPNGTLFGEDRFGGFGILEVVKLLADVVSEDSQWEQYNKISHCFTHVAKPDHLSIEGYAGGYSKCCICASCYKFLQEKRTRGNHVTLLNHIGVGRVHEELFQKLAASASKMMLNLSCTGQYMKNVPQDYNPVHSCILKW